MSWFYLVIASIFEVGWPFGMKMASISSLKLAWIFFAIVAMALSGFFLYLAQREMSIGTAYAVWTGIGAGCTFLLGVLVFNDTLSLVKSLGIILIILGVILLKISH